MGCDIHEAFLHGLGDIHEIANDRSIAVVEGKAVAAYDEFRLARGDRAIGDNRRAVRESVVVPAEWKRGAYWAGTVLERVSGAEHSHPAPFDREAGMGVAMAGSVDWRDRRAAPVVGAAVLDQAIDMEGVEGREIVPVQHAGVGVCARVGEDRGGVGRRKDSGAIALAEDARVLHVVAVGMGDQCDLDALQASLLLERREVLAERIERILPWRPYAVAWVDHHPRAG